MDYQKEISQSCHKQFLVFSLTYLGMHPQQSSLPATEISSVGVGVRSSLSANGT